MFLYYKDTCIYYKRADQGGKTVLLLHGFGADSKAVDCLFYFLKNRKYSVVSIDFPGFGESDDPYGAWSIYDYADCVEFVITALKLSETVVLGHSFGGRVGIILANRGICEGLILVDSAGLRPRKTPVYYYKVASYKLKRSLGLRCSNVGSKDYKSLSVNMRATFVRVVNAHLDHLLDGITVPTLILWGKHDRETPLFMAKKLKKKIKNSTLHVLEGGHFSYIDSYNETCMLMENFLCAL